MKHKVTKKKLKAFAKEEKKTARLYKKLGFKTQGKQEAMHSKYFAKLARRCKK